MCACECGCGCQRCFCTPRRNPGPGSVYWNSVLEPLCKLMYPAQLVWQYFVSFDPLFRSFKYKVIILGKINEMGGGESICTANLFKIFHLILTVLWFGVPRQSEPGAADLPISRIQFRDLAPWGSWHHRERRWQSGPTEWPAEVHGDVPYSFLPTGKVWIPVSHGRRGTLLMKNVLYLFIKLLNYIDSIV